jgi:CheY-like chemotaxis protein
MSGQRSSLAGRRVLLVEDEALIAILTEDLLESAGCHVELASSFDEALAKASSLSFDIAILDVNLAGIFSYPVAQVLVDRGIPYIWTTGYGRQDLADANANAPVLTKPYQQMDLEQLLCEALASR